jgi:hypothetical protein
MRPKMEIEVALIENIKRVKLCGRLDAEGVDQIETQFTASVVPGHRNRTKEPSFLAKPRTCVVFHVSPQWLQACAICGGVYPTRDSVETDTHVAGSCPGEWCRSCG